MRLKYGNRRIRVGIDLHALHAVIVVDSELMASKRSRVVNFSVAG